MIVKFSLLITNSYIIMFIGRPMRLYRTPLTQPVYAVGKTQISHAQAKLFNLFNKNGEINNDNIKNKSHNDSDKNFDTQRYAKTFARVKNLALPRTQDLGHIVVDEEKELTFQPNKSKKATASKSAPCSTATASAPAAIM